MVHSSELNPMCQRFNNTKLEVMVTNYQSDTLHHNRPGANTGLITIHRPSRCSSFISERIICPTAALAVILNIQLKNVN